MYTPAFFLQKPVKNRLFTCDQKQKSFRLARQKSQEARGKKQEYKNLLPKWLKQWHIKCGDCRHKARGEKQEYKKFPLKWLEQWTPQESQSPHFRILPSLFSFYLLNSMSDSVTNSKSYPVTIDSSICSENNHNDYEEACSEESPSKKRKAYNKINVEISWIWSHFKKMEEKKEFAFCDLCMKDVYYSNDYSTSMLIRHMKRHHMDVYQHHLEAKAKAKLAEEGKADAQWSIKPFLITCPSF